MAWIDRRLRSEVLEGRARATRLLAYVIQFMGLGLAVAALIYDWPEVFNLVLLAVVGGSLLHVLAQVWREVHHQRRVESGAAPPPEDDGRF